MKSKGSKRIRVEDVVDLEEVDELSDPEKRATLNDLLRGEKENNK